jgi:hypothetical protein
MHITLEEPLLYILGHSVITEGGEARQIDLPP